LSQRIAVVVNLFLFSNQVSFFESHDLLVSGKSMQGSHKQRSTTQKRDNSDASLIQMRPSTLIGYDTFVNAKRAPADGIRSQYLKFPSRQGRKEARGHCVVAIGYFMNQGKLYVRLRNSFGCRWGFFGDFAMDLEDVCAEQVH
jgi:hypothetical protein